MRKYHMGSHILKATADKSKRMDNVRCSYARTHTSASGFTIIELLVVISIMAILFSILLPVLSMARINARVASSKALITNLKTELENYRAEYNNFPMQPNTTGGVFGAIRPVYYQTPSVGVNLPTDGSEDNSLLIKLLLNRKWNVNLGRIDGSGILRDDFGMPIICRFMVLNPGGLNPSDRLVEMLYIWSYGVNKRNEINASTNYICGAEPNYDKVESDAIEQTNLNGKDDITSWK